MRWSVPKAGRPGRRAAVHRGAAVLASWTLGVTFAMVGGAVPAFAADAHVRGLAVEKTPSVPGVHAVAARAKHLKPMARNYAPSATRWPAADTVSTAFGRPAHAGGTPRPASSGDLKISPLAPAKGSWAGPTAVTVSVATRAAAAKAGVNGVLFQLAPEGAGRGQANVSLNYASFAQAYGADFGGRLQLVKLPECALTTPSVPSCRTQTPVEGGGNDYASKTVTARITLSTSSLGEQKAMAVHTAVPTGTSEAPSTVHGATVLAAISGSGAGDGGGPSGSFASTSLGTSGTWSGGNSSGVWTYSYPMQVPPAPSALAPDLSLDYDSGSVDGQTSQSQAQSSWVGDGWNTPQSFIEETFTSCSDQPEGTASPVSTADDCYAGPLFTMSLDGASTSLVYNASKQTFTPVDDSGLVIGHVTGSGNGDGTYDTDYYTATTPDGTEYYFGLNHLPGWSSGKAATNSVDTVPVYSAHSGDPCYSSSGFTASLCTMGYRYNLDYVKDIHGNAEAYYYNQSTNYYGEDNGAHEVSYVRNSYLAHIDYGFTDGNAYGTVPDTIVFTTGDRCVAGASLCDPLGTGTKANWPDVPYDLVCASGTTCSSHAPSFFSTVRLTTVTTKQWNTTLATPGYSTIDAYTLTDQMPATADGGATLWLQTISHVASDPRATGSASSVTVPLVTFTGVDLPNRINTTGDGLPGLYRWRIGQVETETGSVIDVNYELTSPCTAPVTVTPASNTTSCYPVYWTPSGDSAAIKDWFNKYAVQAVSQSDPTGGGSLMETSYTYSGPAWHYDDNELVQAKYRTYGQWRGYADVKTFTGNGSTDQQTESETHYYQGMSDDNGSGTVSVTDSQGGTHTDSDQLAGQALETTQYSGANGHIDSSVITSYWISPSVATRTRTGLSDLTANIVAPAESWSRQAVTDNGLVSWRDSEADTSYDSTVSDSQFGQVTEEYSHTVPAQTAYDQCTTTSYAPANTAKNLVGLPAQVETDAVACGGFTEGTISSVPAAVNVLTAPSSVSRPDQVVSDMRTIYDDQSDAQTWPQPSYTFPQTSPPSLGEASVTQQASDFNGSTPTWQTTGTTVYDTVGRPTASYDAMGNKTAAAYTTDNVGLVTGVSGTNALNQPTDTETLDPARNLTLTSKDINSVQTTYQYDTLGRITSEWDDSRATTVPANTTYAYNLSASQASSVAVNTLNDANGYVGATELFDALMRPRQSQVASPDGGRLITDTFYDSRGWTSASYNGWYDSTSTPNTTLVSAANLGDHVPDEDFYTYNGLGKVLVDQSDNDGAPVSSTTTVYNGDRITVIPPQGGTITSSATDPLGRISEVDSYTAQPTVTTPTDSFGGIWTVTNGASQAVTYGFDARGDQDSTTSGGQTWSSHYNLLGEVDSKTDPDAGFSSMVYDADGHLLQSTDARHETVSYTYDALGRRLDSFAADTADQSTANKLTENVYDNTDSVLSGAPANYVLGQLTTATSYDGSGNAYVTQSSGFNVFGESLGEKITVPTTSAVGSLAGTYTFSSQYTSVLGLPLKNIFPAQGGLPAETLNHTYTGAQDMPLGLSGLATYQGGITYDAFGRVSSATFGANGSPQARITNLYDSHTSNLTEQLVENAAVGASFAPVDEEQYGYDPAGNITSQTSTRLGQTSTPETQCYQYDGLDRLVGAWTATDACAATPTTGAHSTVGDPMAGGSAYWTTWSFDALGRRQGEIDHSTTGGADQNIGYAYGTGTVTSPSQPDALVSTTPSTGTGNSYTYDNDGNTLTSDTPAGGNQTYNWNEADQLTSVASSTQGTTSYVYGPDGGLLLEESPSATTLYLPDEQLTLNTVTQTTSGTRYYALPAGGTAVRTGTGTNYGVEFGNQQGTSSLYLDSTFQNPTWRQFTPYGAPRGSATTWVDNRGFLNAPSDPTTGLTILGARQYDPTTGRFLSLDPLFEATDQQQLNGYTYSADNPVTGADPSGNIMLPVEDLGGGGWGAVTVWLEEEAEDFHPNWNAPDRSGDGDDAERGGEDKPQRPPQSETSKAADSDNQETEARQRIEEERAAAAERAVQAEREANMRAQRQKAAQDAMAKERAAEARTSGGSGGDPAAGTDSSGEPEAPTQPDTVQSRDSGKASLADQTQSAEDASATATDSDASDDDQCLNSFAPDTKVLMADGASKPIAKIKRGDEVQAANPTTGKYDKPRKVIAVLVHHDTDLTDVKVQTSPGHTAVLRTTDKHPFWDATTHSWVAAGDLTSGQRLITNHNASVTVVSVVSHTGRATRDNLTVDRDHTYYVLAGTTPILVHNCNWDMTKIDEKYDKHVFGDGKRPGEGPDMAEYQDEVDGVDGFDRYQQDACGLMCGPKGSNVREVIRSGDGAILRLDTSTGRLGIMQNGKITNFFRPDDPVAYMENESGR